MIEVRPDLDSALVRHFATPAEDARVGRTAAALQANGFTVFRATDGAEAKRIVVGLITEGGDRCTRARHSPWRHRASPRR